MIDNNLANILLGHRIIITENCCDNLPVRKHKKKRINKKWLKRYGRHFVPKKEIVVANLYNDKLIICHPKYWEIKDGMLLAANKRSKFYE